MGPERRGEPVRVRFFKLGSAVAGRDGKFVRGARAHFRHEPSPNPRASLQAKRVGADRPVVEIAEHGHCHRFRGPHRETGACPPLVSDPVGPQLFVATEMGSFGKQVQVKIGEKRRGHFRSNTAMIFSMGIKIQSGRLLIS